MVAFWCCYNQCNLCTEEKGTAGGVAFGEVKIPSTAAGLHAQSGWGIAMTGDDSTPAGSCSRCREENTATAGNREEIWTTGISCWCRNETGRTAGLLLRLVPAPAGRWRRKELKWPAEKKKEMRGDFYVEKWRGKFASERRKEASVGGFLALPLFLKWKGLQLLQRGFRFRSFFYVFSSPFSALKSTPLTAKPPSLYAPLSLVFVGPPLTKQIPLF